MRLKALSGSNSNYIPAATLLEGVERISVSNGGKYSGETRKQ